MEDDFLAYSIMRKNLSDFGFAKETITMQIMSKLKIEKYIVGCIGMDYLEDPYHEINILLRDNKKRHDVADYVHDFLKRVFADFGVDDILIEYRGYLYKEWDCYNKLISDNKR